ncbi:MAG: universal stress protein [Thermodesulfobacteriota bacterium]
MAPIKIKKFLIVVDNSDNSLAAVKYVAELGLGRKAGLVLLHVFDHIPANLRDLECDPRYTSWLTSEALEARQRINIEDFMERARQILLESGLTENSIETRIQARVHGIARDIMAESRKGYLGVIMGRTGSGNVPGLVMGSVANKLLSRLTNVNLCLVTGRPDPHKIMVAVDSSAGAERAVDFLPLLTQGRTQEVTLFHAFKGHDLALPKADESTAGDQRVDVHATLASLFEPVFTKAIARLTKAGLEGDRISTKLVTNVFSRAVAIVDESHTGGFGTILVGRQGLSMVREYYLGRVSGKVIQLAQNAAIWVVR